MQAYSIFFTGRLKQLGHLQVLWLTGITPNSSKHLFIIGFPGSPTPSQKEDPPPLVREGGVFPNYFLGRGIPLPKLFLGRGAPLPKLFLGSTPPLSFKEALPPSLS